jgi:signal transduction histidine kinase/CheY-like chemotaxis protein
VDDGTAGLLHELYEKVPVGVFAVGPNGVTVMANSAFRALTGTDTLEGWLATLPASERDAWQACFVGGEPLRREIATHDTQGRPLWLRWRALRLGSGAVAGTLSDVSEIEQARAEASAASRAKTEFLANMSHEIRTPMSSIVGMTDLLWETDLGAMQRKYVAILREAGEHLLALISDLLDLSRVEAGELGLERHEFNLREQMDRAIDLVADRARAKKLDLYGRVAPEVPHYVVGDPLRLRQVLVNLLVNAVKFTERGEVVATIEPNGDGALRFSVRDTGAGIAADDLERVFRPFEQVSRQKGGVGLGLTISRRLIEQMGGQLRVDSEPGRGSTFWFDVKLPPAGAAANRPSLVAVNLRGLSILVADENDTSRLILHEMLAGWGAKCEELTEVARVAEVGGRFDVVVLTRNFSDGAEALVRELRARRPASQQAIVLIVSELRPGDDERQRALEVRSLLLKPVRRRELFDALNGAVGESGLSTARPRPPATPLRILLADDNADSRLLVETLLEGNQVESVDNGRAAVDALASQRYDLVLMDVEMPVLDGLAAIREIRERERREGSAAVPIVAMTAHAAAEDAAASQAAGATLHLPKPITRASLLEAVAAATRPPRPPIPTERVRVEVTPTVAALVPGFLANRQKDLRSARAALKRRDWHGLWVLAHTMKGLGASYGFDGITEIGVALEKAALAHEDAGVARAVDELESYLSRVDYAVAS